ncbi:MAG TPA: hypothetical protein VF719_12275 [Abditibacteriaceae bacterium]|jgi:hypothetical protein
MALTKKAYSLKNVRITFLGGLVADATKITIKRKPEFKGRRAGSSYTNQRVLNGEEEPDIEVEGWNSDNLAFGDLVPGTPIESFTLLSTETGTPSIMQTDFFTKWPVAGMCLGETETTIEEDPSKWKTRIEAGILDLPEA